MVYWAEAGAELGYMVLLTWPSGPNMQDVEYVYITSSLWCQAGILQTVHSLCKTNNKANSPMIKHCIFNDVIAIQEFSKHLFNWDSNNALVFKYRRYFNWRVCLSVDV